MYKQRNPWYKMNPCVWCRAAHVSDQLLKLPAVQLRVELAYEDLARIDEILLLESRHGSEESSKSQV